MQTGYHPVVGFAHNNMVCCRRAKSGPPSACSDLENEMQQLLALWESTAESKTQAEDAQTACKRLMIVAVLLDGAALYYPGLAALKEIPYLVAPAVFLPLVCFCLSVLLVSVLTVGAMSPTAVDAVYPRKIVRPAGEEVPLSLGNVS